MTLECARSIREDFLQQNAFDDVDTYTSPEKQHAMLAIILSWYDKGLAAIAEDVAFSKVTSMAALEGISRMKYVPEGEFAAYMDGLKKQLNQEFAAMTEGGQADA